MLEDGEGLETKSIEIDKWFGGDGDRNTFRLPTGEYVPDESHNKALNRSIFRTLLLQLERHLKGRLKNVKMNLLCNCDNLKGSSVQQASILSHIHLYDKTFNQLRKRRI